MYKKKLPHAFFGFLMAVPFIQAAAQTELYLGHRELSVISPCPEAAALRKYGDIPISEYTGAVNFSVPNADITGYNNEADISITNFL